MDNNGESIKPPEIPVEPARELPQTTGPKSEPQKNLVQRTDTDKERDVGDYLKEILSISRERFFDTDQAVTLVKENYDFLPGYASTVGVVNHDGNMEVVVTYMNGFDSNLGGLYENLGGEEIHVSYRKKVGQGAIRSRLLRKPGSYEYGNMVFTSGAGGARTRKPFSIKSTMRPFDVKLWEEGYTATSSSIGNYEGQIKLEPTTTDYEEILNTVKRGRKDDKLTDGSVAAFRKGNTQSHLIEQHSSEALNNLQTRVVEILRGEKLAQESADYSMTTDIGIEADQPGEDSFEIAEKRLRDVALGLTGDDPQVIHDVADNLVSISKTIDMVHTLLGSNDPAIKSQLRSLTLDGSQPELNPKEMFELLAHITEHSKFQDFRNSHGFSTDVLYGASLSNKYGPERDDAGHLTVKTASPRAKIEILRALGFLRPDEKLVDRIGRIKGEPAYDDAGGLGFFRYDHETGEAISWSPYRSRGEYSSVSITSPLFGPNITAQIGVNLRVGEDGERDRLEPANEDMEYITLRINTGEAMMRVSKDRSKLRLGEANDMV